MRLVEAWPLMNAGMMASLPDRAFRITIGPAIEIIIHRNLFYFVRYFSKFLKISFDFPQKFPTVSLVMCYETYNRQASRIAAQTARQPVKNETKNSNTETKEKVPAHVPKSKLKLTPA